MTIGILSDTSLPLPLLLDAINHAEVGHLPRNQQLTVISDDGAEGPYQFLPKNLHDMGYGMPQNIPVADIRDYKKARGLAGKYVTGFSEELGFKTPLEQLVAYTAGPTFASDWVARGANIEELGPRTQSYIKRAAAYLNNNYTQQQEPQMADMTFDLPLFGPVPFDADGAVALKQMAGQGNPVAEALVSRINEAALTAEIERRMAAMQSNAPAPVAPAPVAPAPVLAEPPEGVQYNVGGGASSQTPALYQPGTVPSGMGSVAAGGVLAAQTQGPSVAITEANGFTRNPPPNVSNRRDQSAMSLQPPPRGNINDLLIRMGSAGLRGAQQGGLESMAAMGDAYTAYKAAERDSIAKYNQSLAKMAGKKQRPGGNPVSPYNAVVLDTLNDIIPALDGDTSWFSAEAGLPGAIFRMMPGSRATDYAAKLDTLKANIGFDRLQKMRDESPTGGALGQVSEMELRQLNAALGSLEQNQSPQQLQENLKRIRDHYIRAVSALEAEYAAAGIDISSKIQPMGSAGGQSANNNLSAADEIVGIN